MKRLLLLLLLVFACSKEHDAQKINNYFCNRCGSFISSDTTIIRTKKDTTLFQNTLKEGLCQKCRSILSYTIFRQWTIGKNAGIGMEILVSPKMPKEDVLYLAEELRNENIKKGELTIFIFDSEEVCKNRENLKYPEDKFFKHFLVLVNTLPAGTDGKVLWVAKNRQEPIKK